MISVDGARQAVWHAAPRVSDDKERHDAADSVSGLFLR
jgi:hypothetical protein